MHKVRQSRQQIRAARKLEKQQRMRHPSGKGKYAMRVKRRETSKEGEVDEALPELHSPRIVRTHFYFS